MTSQQIHNGTRQTEPWNVTIGQYFTVLTGAQFPKPFTEAELGTPESLFRGLACPIQAVRILASNEAKRRLNCGELTVGALVENFQAPAIFAREQAIELNPALTDYKLEIARGFARGATLFVLKQSLEEGAPEPARLELARLLRDDLDKPSGRDWRSLDTNWGAEHFSTLVPPMLHFMLEQKALFARQRGLGVTEEAGEIAKVIADRRYVGESIIAILKLEPAAFALLKS